MRKLFTLAIVSTEQALYEGEATMVLLPAAMGQIGILAGHSPLLTQLEAGEIRVNGESGILEYFYVEGGIVEVQPTIVTVLSDTALRTEQLDREAALKAKRSAERSLANHPSGAGHQHAHLELIRAMARLKALENLSRRKHHR